MHGFAQLQQRSRSNQTGHRVFSGTYGKDSIRCPHQEAGFIAPARQRQSPAIFESPFLAVPTFPDACSAYAYCSYARASDFIELIGPPGEFSGQMVGSNCAARLPHLGAAPLDPVVLRLVFVCAGPGIGADGLRIAPQPRPSRSDLPGSHSRSAVAAPAVGPRHRGQPADSRPNHESHVEKMNVEGQ